MMRAFEHHVGKAWGQYVWVAGPFDTKRDAISALQLSVITMPSVRHYLKAVSQ